MVSIALNIIQATILNQINRTAGLLLGAVQGLVVVWLLFIILTVISGSQLGETAFQQINSSGILSFI